MSNKTISEVRNMLSPKETFNYEFRGNASEIDIFRKECARLRIKTTTSIVALGMSKKQSESIHNLATAIILK